MLSTTYSSCPVGARYGQLQHSLIGTFDVCACSSKVPLTFQPDTWQDAFNYRGEAVKTSNPQTRALTRGE